MKEFAFDVMLRGALRVCARSEDEARAKLAKIDGLDALIRLEDGSPITGEISLDSGVALYDERQLDM